MRNLMMGMVLAALAAGLVGCGPSKEERKAMEVFNSMDDMIKHGGYVKKFERFEQRPDKVFIIEAEIVDANEVPLGLLRSERVEGFGTARPRIQWYKTPGVREEWTAPQGRRGRRRSREGEGTHGERDGTRTREGAATAPNSP